MSISQVDYPAMADLSLDAVLDLEDEFYAKGYEDGQQQSSKEQYVEGKIYGLQTGFQRFLVVGYIQGLLAGWRKIDSKSVQLHLDQLEKLVSDIPLTNGDLDVEKYERAVVKARNKVRVVATLTKTGGSIANLDSLLKEVGGSLQVSENVDDMW